ncbi:50S ribosomal protein L4 [bacterium]|nr:50S ribosomal protein L4 [bacterium]
MTLHKTDGGQAPLELSDAVFGAEANAHCVRAAVAQYMANQRQGTHATKMRGAVSGGGKKPFKQKGTGRARQGSTRAPQYRHGAIIFGPQPRDYSYRINKKVRQQAYRSILSELAASGRLIAVEGFGLESPKTSKIDQALRGLGVDGPTLLVVDHADDVLTLSVRNIPWVTMINVENLNVYDLLANDWIVATAGALKRVEEQYA